MHFGSPDAHLIAPDRLFLPIQCNTDHDDIYGCVHVHLCTSPGDIWLIYVHVVTHTSAITEKKIGFDERQVHCTLGLVSIHKHSLYLRSLDFLIIQLKDALFMFQFLSCDAWISTFFSK